MKQTKIKPAPYLFLSLVFLFNPNINIIDFLPDFVAYFILAHLMEKAADSAPYFEEARRASIKLAWISFAKIPAFFLVFFIRSNNTLDNDVFAMAGTVFAVLEIIFLISLIKNISSALFYLGERGSAAALITPFPISKNGQREMRPEDLRTYTVMFAICKCLLYALPEFLLLSGTTSSGVLMPAPLSRFYPITLLISITLGFIISRAKKYVRAILLEGKFTSSLKFLARADSEKKFETKVKLRSVKSSLSLLAISTVFFFKLALKETEMINVLPHFLFGVLFLIALYKLKKHSTASFKPVFFSGILYSVVSLIYFVLSVNFLSKYDYSNLINNPAVKGAYIPVIILAVIEFISFTAFAILSARFVYGFIYSNTGVEPTSERYKRTEAGYHAEIKKKCNIMIGSGILAALVNCIDVILYYNAQKILSDVNDTAVTVITSSVPWFNVIITVSTLFFIGYTVYFTGVLKEECELKYSKE